MSQNPQQMPPQAPAQVPLAWGDYTQWLQARLPVDHCAIDGDDSKESPGDTRVEVTIGMGVYNVRGRRVSCTLRTLRRFNKIGQCYRLSLTCLPHNAVVSPHITSITPAYMHRPMSHAKH